MRLLLRSNYTWFWIGLVAAYWIFASVTPLASLLLIVNCFALVTMALVATVYFPTAIRAIRRNDLSPEARAMLYISVGIVCSYGFSALGRAHNILWLQSLKRQDGAANILTAFWQYGVAVGGVYLLLSPGALGRTKRARVFSTISVVAGSILLAVVLEYADLDTTPLIDWLRPYVS